MSSRYFCHQCQQSVGLRDTDLICGLCGSDFIEQLPLSAQAFRSDYHTAQPGVFPTGPASNEARFGFIPLEEFNAMNNVHARARRRRGTPPPGLAPVGARMDSIGDAPGSLLERIQGLLGPLRFTRSNRQDNNGTQQGPSGAAGQDERPEAAQGGQQAGQQQQQNPQGSPLDVQDMESLFRMLSEVVNGGANGPLRNVQFQIHIGDGNGERLHANIGDYAFGNMDRLISELMNHVNEHGQQNLTDEELSRIPMTTVSQKHVDNQTQCSTCFETFALDEPVAQLNCEHIFHHDCVVPWLRQHKTCPMCRNNVDASEWPARANEGSNAPPGAPAGMVDQDELD